MSAKPPTRRTATISTSGRRERSPIRGPATRVAIHFRRHGNLFFPQFGTYINMPINPKPTYVAQWNVTYQRQIREGLAGFGKLPGQQDHASLDRRGKESRAYILGHCACAVNTA